ncbi:DUF817 domain-containing protein [Tropicibacter naphthalenivorans]|uniref:Putative integral membrane protein n=1 Tax=Tropicibacter naphthalenivorans TaxID=441103 RepID=A0A0P1GLZ4_9RHOB|nr:DUF817 domain-containing protein [Tropicibacter naphthalenivorans]CUH75196.1 putative integral membrane protein [Tropicibacter naphthalenivorans]SMC45677.1 Uncharacterized membrane protein YoaT, DUF817 family [Tropicibacter naphthalenivorans]
MTSTRSIERRLGDWTRAHLPAGLREFTMFLLKQAWACLFGFLMLGGLLVSDRIWQDGWALARYDALLIYAVAIQASFLALRLETLQEARVILLFHLTGTAMELFKVNAGSWAYPEPAVMKFYGVPLFSGFMYAAVGSYMARVIRIFDMRFAPYPPFWVSVLLAGAIYVNFFAHHYLPDVRWVLIAATLMIFARTRVWFTIGQTPRWMPLPLAAFLTSIFLWIAENIGTNTGTWLYAGQTEFDLVHLSKMGSWYMLLYVSFTTVTLVVRDVLSRAPLRPQGSAPRSTPSEPRSPSAPDATPSL